MNSIAKAVMLACLSVSCLPALAGEAAPFGWRGDGSGRYPNANPPLEWSRIAKTVTELSAQASKPKDDALPAKKSALADGVLHDWLILGPITLTDEMKSDEPLAGAEAMSPDKDEKAGDLKWQAMKVETNCMDLCALLNVSTTQKGVAAYAHTYIYSPGGGPVAYNLLAQGQGCNRAWLNGAQVFTSGKNAEIGPGWRIVLPLKKGWNRLLLLNSKTIANRKSWWNTGSLYGDKGAEYDTRGLVWMTPIPIPGASAPVIAGDRIYFTGETGSVICVNKADGKILWVRSLTYYDFATEEERKANPEVFKALEPFAARVKELDGLDAVTPWKPPAMEKDMRCNAEVPIIRDMAKVSKERYGNPATWGCEAGFTAGVPVTDGRNVYALFGTGIVACYDPDGKCLWKRLLHRRMVEHGYTTSPLLVDGKLIVYLDDFTVLDAKTGQVVLERPHFVPEGKEFNWYLHFHGSGCVIPAGNEKVLYFLNGEFVRLSDGKSLTLADSVLKKLQPWPYWSGGANRCATPTVDNGIVYKMTGGDAKGFGVATFKLPALQGDKVEPEILHEMHFNTEKFPYYYGACYCAAPLLHDGLLYCLDDFGVLTVLDVAKEEVVYQRLLDLEVYMPYAGAGYLKGGASASPTLAGKYIYIWGNQGTSIVIEPGRTFKQVARNRLEAFTGVGYPHQDATSTEPIFEGNRLYYRGEYTIFCIGAK